VTDVVELPMEDRATLVTADWVLPVLGEPIFGGGVLVVGDRIAAVGSAATLAAAHPEATRIDQPGCALIPGLVNAHTHLALSSLAGLTPPGPLHPWLRGVTRAILGLEHSEFGVAAAMGSLQCLRSGTTTVGDIVYGSESADGAARIGLAGVFFFEVLGLRPDETSESLERRGWTGAPAEHGDAAATRIREGLSPHAPYSSGPGLLAQVRQLARERHQPFAIHVAESVEEAQLLEEGTGPFLDQTTRLAHGFVPPMTSPVAYLHELGVLDDALCIHAIHVSDRDAALIAQHARGVALCPRSNAYLANGVPPVRLLREAGVRIAIGTDSLASNHDLDLFAEARAVREVDPAFPPAEVLRAITLSGAEVLGMGDLTGALEPGRLADLAVVALDAAALDAGADPVSAVLNRGGRETVRSVMCAGEWRLLDHALTFDVADLEAEAVEVIRHTAELVGEVT
jgi:5-methylthioadenosine/S-adenosylhomocysteine deaminase